MSEFDVDLPGEAASRKPAPAEDPAVPEPEAEPLPQPVDSGVEPRDEGAGGGTPVPGLSIEEEEPPDETAPPFRILLNAFGPGTHSVKLPDGTPVGVWLVAEHSELNGDEVHALLRDMGLEEPHASDFARRRMKRGEAAQLLAEADAPLWREFVASEENRDRRMTEVRAAFIKAQGKKT